MNERGSLYFVPFSLSLFYTYKINKTKLRLRPNLFHPYSKLCFFLRTFFRPQKIVWHGASTNGERSMDTYCDAWHSASSDKVGLASSLLGNKLLDQERYSCDNRFAVLCIEALTQERRRKKRDVHR